jgi:hypothetical protein
LDGTKMDRDFAYTTTAHAQPETIVTTMLLLVMHSPVGEDCWDEFFRPREAALVALVTPVLAPLRWLTLLCSPHGPHGIPTLFSPLLRTAARVYPHVFLERHHDSKLTPLGIYLNQGVHSRCRDAWDYMLCTIAVACGDDMEAHPHTGQVPLAQAIVRHKVSCVQWLLQSKRLALTVGWRCRSTGASLLQLAIEQHTLYGFTTTQCILALVQYHFDQVCGELLPTLARQMIDWTPLILPLAQLVCGYLG